MSPAAQAEVRHGVGAEAVAGAPCLFGRDDAAEVSVTTQRDARIRRPLGELGPGAVDAGLADRLRIAHGCADPHRSERSFDTGRIVTAVLPGIEAALVAIAGMGAVAAHRDEAAKASTHRHSNRTSAAAEPKHCLRRSFL